MRALHALNNSTTSGTHDHLRALARLRSVGTVCTPHTFTALLSTQWAWLGHRLHGRSHWSSDSDRIRVVASSTFDPVSRRQERVESLDQLGIAGKQLADSSNYAWSVDGATLKVLHYIEEAIVNVRVISELYFDLIKIAQGVVENGLLTLSLSLSLTLTLTHLLLLRTLRLSLSKGHEQSGCVACVLSLSRLDWTSSEHVVGSLWTTKWELSLRLWSGQTGVAEQAIRAMNSAWTDSNWLVQMHRLALRLVLWGLFQSLTLLLPMLSVLLLFDVNLLALTIGSLSLASGLAECR